MKYPKVLESKVKICFHACHPFNHTSTFKTTLTIFSFFFTICCSAQTFTLKSKELGGQATSRQLLNGFGCTGENISPQMLWENAPKNTKSYAITMFDENARTGSGWWHWVIFDIPSQCSEILSDAGNVKRGIAPPGCIQSKTDFGTLGYSGPCPPPKSGFHKYILTIYALDTEKLGLDANANPAMVGFYLSNHTLGKASIITYYKN
ncbi:YbhB/YbcL family Raf kinase inhibitor-like protein [Pedobacter sp. Du54]|uniref:YbhB/YbcL family Raf kinase inhibitor-like protein n=1 Tax=Pedobacter anseongensis TaxID=3133439 RepID=UPI0030A2AD02